MRPYKSQFIIHDIRSKLLYSLCADDPWHAVSRAGFARSGRYHVWRIPDSVESHQHRHDGTCIRLLGYTKQEGVATLLAIIEDRVSRGYDNQIVLIDTKGRILK